MIDKNAKIIHTIPATQLEVLNQHLYAIIGCLHEVHSNLGKGLEEAIYNEALCLELRQAGIKCETECPLACYYKGQKLNKTYRMDIVCYEDVILELKSVEQLTAGHREQLFNYMRLTKMPIGMLVNFNAPRMMPEKYYLDINSNEVIRFY